MKRKILNALIKKGLIISSLAGLLFLILTGLVFQNSLSVFPLTILYIIVGSLSGLIVFIFTDVIKGITKNRINRTTKLR